MSHSWHCGGAGSYIPVIARVFIGLIFFVLGLGKISGIDGFVGYMAMLGFPMPMLFAWAVIGLEVVGGAMIIAGFHARFAAWALALFTLATIPVAHRDLADQNQLTQALKNLSIVGGLLYVAKFGSGKWSIRQSNCGCCADCATCPTETKAQA